MGYGRGVAGRAKLKRPRIDFSESLILGGPESDKIRFFGTGIVDVVRGW